VTKITFGIIALNAQPFLEYNLKGLYPFAHQIIVVEGATKAAASLATHDGHSIDGTLQMLKQFQSAKDIEKKIEIVSAIDEGYVDGFWPEKNEMSQAYAKRTTGSWLWQVDSDEFYRAKDIQRVLGLLTSQPDTSGISFPFYEFWGGFDYVTTGKWYLQDFTEVPRLFKWKPGYKYINHRPPTIVDEKNIPANQSNWIKSSQMRKLDIYMYHYSYVFPKQAEQKVGYYSNVSWTTAFRKNQQWLKDTFYGLKRPFFLNEKGWPVLQWLERFPGNHPEIINQLRSDLATGVLLEDDRKNGDIEKLLHSRRYRLLATLLHIFMPIYWSLRKSLRPKNSRVQ
jgi:hypothetical protein